MHDEAPLFAYFGGIVIEVESVKGEVGNQALRVK